MFTKLFRRTAVAQLIRETEQLTLDQLRYDNANNQLMQLHLDRMQSAMEASVRTI